MKIEDSLLREFYEIPGEEIPYTAYEFDKVKGLGDRVRSTLSSESRNNVHIISGRESLQVRRIAYLTAKNIEDSGASIVPVRQAEAEEHPDRTKGTDSVFLVDEHRLKEDAGEEGSDIHEIINDTIARTHRLARNGHSILLSLSQETYEAHFRAHVDGDGIISYREKAVEKKSSGKAVSKKEKKHDLGKYWTGAILLAASMAVSPMLHGSVSFANYTFYEKSGFDAFLRESLVLLMAALTVAGLVYMALSSVNLKGGARAVSVSGIILFSAEALVPLVLYVAGVFPQSSHISPDSGAVITSYLTPGSVEASFLIFQSAAAVSFVLIPFAYADKYGRSGLIAAFVISIIFLAISVESPLTSLPYRNPIPIALATFPFFVVPYNTPVFGFFYNQGLILSIGGIAAAYASQWLFAAVYAMTGLRSRFEWWRDKDNTVLSLTGKL